MEIVQLLQSIRNTYSAREDICNMRSNLSIIVTMSIIVFFNIASVDYLSLIYIFFT